MESDRRCERQEKGALEELMRERIRTTIESLVDEEREAALGAARSQRVGLVRTGYRHGERARTLTSSLGQPPSPCRGPGSRAKMAAGAGGAAESFRAISAAPSESTRRSSECT